MYSEVYSKSSTTLYHPEEEGTIGDGFEKRIFFTSGSWDLQDGIITIKMFMHSFLKTISCCE